MPSWFDLDDIPVTTEGSYTHENTIRDSVKTVHNIVDEVLKENPNLPSNRI